MTNPFEEMINKAKQAKQSLSSFASNLLGNNKTVSNKISSDNNTLSEGWDPNTRNISSLNSGPSISPVKTSLMSDAWNPNAGQIETSTTSFLDGAPKTKKQIVNNQINIDKEDLPWTRKYEVKDGVISVDKKKIDSNFGKKWDPSRVINGHDMNSYASDPNQVRNIKMILDAMPDINSASDIVSYITSKPTLKDSPLKDHADYIYKLCELYDIDPKMFIATAQAEGGLNNPSNTKPINTKNPLNIGNVDSGAVTDMDSWKTGILSGIIALAERKR